MMDLFNCLGNFVAIVEHNSFAEVARKRYINASALSKQMNWLEEHFQTRLLQRSTRHVAVTEEGAKVYDYALKLLNNHETIKNELTAEASQLSGRIRMTVPINFGDAFIVDLILDFAKLHPNLQITLDLSNRYIDLIAEGYDLAIRSTKNVEARYFAAEIGKVKRGVFAAPKYLKQFGIPKMPSDLLQHQCIVHPDLQPYAKWRFKDNVLQEVPVKMVSNSLHLHINAALMGLALVHMANYRILAELAAGKLISVLDDYTPTLPNIYIIYPKQQFIPKKVKVLLEFLQQRLVDKLAND